MQIQPPIIFDQDTANRAEEGMQMAPRNILANFALRDHVDRLLNVAAPLVRRFDARIDGLHVIPPVQIYADSGLSVGAALYKTQEELFETEADAIETAFADRCKSDGLDNSWQRLSAGTGPAMQKAVAAGRLADLVLAAQYDPENPAAAYFPEDLVMGSGRPVILVPSAGTFGDIGSRILIAWNGGREAARAVFDALVLFRPDAAIEVLTAQDGGHGEAAAITAPEALAQVLARHGFKTAISHSRGGELPVGEDILSRAADFSADLIVMGGYGHTRLRETVFGGATRTILKHMTVPVLMAH
jgi:nucleotide-binding universal stress UspA family protein